MTTMLERVAREIVMSRGLNPDKISLEDGITPIWKYHICNARAAIETLREPSEGVKAYILKGEK